MAVSYSSFSSSTKEALNKIQNKCKKECCRNSFLYGSRLELPSDGFICSECRSVFLRGVFIKCGTIVKPDSGYHLELIMPDSAAADAVSAILNDSGLAPKTTVRKGTPVLYYKESEAIEDFLNYIGAHKAAFELINMKILKDIRNNVNRAANCDAANITKTINAAQVQVDAISALIESGKIEEIPSELRETAYLRLQYPDLSLSELAQLHAPPISKSGLNHRLNKIMHIV